MPLNAAPGLCSTFLGVRDDGSGIHYQNNLKKHWIPFVVSLSDHASSPE
jgi:hypothetical protein